MIYSYYDFYEDQMSFLIKRPTFEDMYIHVLQVIGY